MFLHNTLRQKVLNLLLLAASVMLLVGLTSCSNDAPVAPEVVVADFDGILAAPPTWQGFSPILNNSEEAASEIAPVVGDMTYSKSANPMVNGKGTWETQIGTVGFQVSVVELPDGTIHGQGVSTMHTESGNAWFHFEVLDAAPYGEEFAVLGLITDTFNSPPQFLGSLTMLIIQDNEPNGSDMVLSGAGLPPWLTLDDILYGPNPPPSLRFPLAHGNFTLH
jgi:hypothetical protein